MSTTVYDKKIEAHILVKNCKYIYLKKCGISIKYNQCNKFDIDSDLYVSCINHKNKNIKPLAWAYLGMGHYAIIIDDDNGFYHSLHIGGSNDWERLANVVSYNLYNFDEPCGRISDLDTDLNIYPNNMNMVNKINKIYSKLAYETNLVQNMDKFFDVFYKEVAKL
ncbi:putative orfan [Tupanvirus soda lake]|uniref:Orfan n=2 Tax=Tupanvirus TaxID=2094720 RepID=A0AC62ACC8_9VIRU|nr:putative orfan [Tupanvirus soda lake]QKU35411.1 putative orfan [Tupanvirus soda lake]